MGFIRSSLLFIIGILLLVSFLAGNVFLTLALSITPENIQKQVVSNFDEISELAGDEINLTEELKENFGIIEEYCINNSDYVFSEQGYTVDIPCEIVEQGPDAVMKEGIKDIIDKVYYEDYSCDSFWKCLLSSENPLFLLSEESSGKKHARISYLVIVSTIILVIVSFFTSTFLIDTFFPNFSDGVFSLQLILVSLIPISVSSVFYPKLQALESTKVGIPPIFRIISLLLLVIILGNMYGLLGLSLAVLISSSIETLFLGIIFYMQNKLKSDKIY